MNLALPIAVRLDALGMPARPAISAASRLRFAGLEVTAIGEFNPKELSQTGRRELKNLIAKQPLQLAGLMVGNQRAFSDQVRLEARRQLGLETIRLAADISAKVVTVAPGPIPADQNSPAYAAFEDSLRMLASEAERWGVRLALETGPDDPADLANYLASHEMWGLGITYDPGNLIARKFDPFVAGRQFAQDIVLTHVKDLLRQETSVAGYKEVPFGTGEFPFARLAEFLAEISYQGFLVIERERPSTHSSALLAELEASQNVLRSYFH